MSVEQCSGSAASYADKYVTGKLFLIDDTEDADSMDNSHIELKESAKSKALKSALRNSLSGIEESLKDEFLKDFSLKGLGDIAKKNEKELEKMVSWFN